MVSKNSVLQFSIILALVCFLPLAALGVQLWEVATYTTTTAEDITIAWDPESTATEYRWEIRNKERANTVFAQGTTALTQITVKMPKTGHNIFRVTSCNASGCADDGQGGTAWSESTDSAVSTVNGQPKGWWIFAWVEQPTGGF